jgi:hypothetical protein
MVDAEQYCTCTVTPLQQWSRTPVNWGCILDRRENVKWIFSPPINFCDTTFFRRKCIMLNNPDATELPLVIQTGKNYTGPVQR